MPATTAGKGSSWYFHSQGGNRRFWDETVKVCCATERVVPVFVGKHLSDTWDDAKAIYDTAREPRSPSLAGSSVPETWRHPPVDVARDAWVAEIAALTGGTTDAYGFYALEARAGAAPCWCAGV